MSSELSYSPVHSKLRIVRQQTFEFGECNSSTRFGILTIILGQLEVEKFTGKVCLNFNCGGMNNITTEDSKSLP